MVNKNTALLDQLWILCAFPSVLTEFKKKCSAISREKRQQEKAFVEEQAKEIGKKEALQEVRGMLSENVAELPWYLPNQETMEEMIHDHVCKVCGSPAPEGSAAYNFMVNKLNEYKKHIAAKLQMEEEKAAVERKQLFTSGYIEELHNMSIRLGGNKEAQIAHISTDIFDRLSLEDRLREELKKVEDKKQETEDEKARLLIQAGNVSEELLQKSFLDIKGMFERDGKDWNKFFMGKDSEYTFYIDAVNHKFAGSSLAQDKFDMTDDVTEMFNVIRGKYALADQFKTIADQKF